MRNYLNKAFFLFLSLLLIPSCTTDEKSSHDRVLSIENPKALSELIGTIRYVSLYNDTVPFSGRIDKIMSKGDTLYLLDCMISKSLRAYTKEGKFLYSVGIQGRGRGEYVEMMGFTIDDNYFYCIDNAKQELLMYDIHSGDFVKQLNMPNYANDMALLDNGNVMFFVDGEPGVGKIFITDQNLTVIDEIYPTTTDDYCFLSSKSVFTQTKEHILFSRYAKDEIVLFDKKDHKNRAHLTMDFGRYTASKEDKTDNERLRKTKHLIPPVYWVGNRLVGNMHLPKKQQKNDFWRYGSFVYDLQSDQIYSNNKIEELLSRNTPIDAKFLFPFCGVVGDEVVTLLDSYVRYDELVELGFQPAPRALKEQFDDGEMLLVFYKLTR